MEQQGRQTVISFYGTVAAAATAVLISKRINVPFRVRRVRVSFPLNTNRTVQISFLIAEDNDATNTAAPTGANILAQLGQVEYLVGDDEIKDLPVELEVEASGKYIKLRAVNSDTFEHTVDAQMIVELLPRKTLIDRAKEVLTGGS